MGSFVASHLVSNATCDLTMTHLANGVDMYRTAQWEQAYLALSLNNKAALPYPDECRSW